MKRLLILFVLVIIGCSTKEETLKDFSLGSYTFADTVKTTVNNIDGQLVLRKLKYGRIYQIEFIAKTNDLGQLINFNADASKYYDIILKSLPNAKNIFDQIAVKENVLYKLKYEDGTLNFSLTDVDLFEKRELPKESKPDF